MAGKVQTAAGPSGQMRRPAGSGERMEQQMPKKKKKAKRFYDYSLLFCIIFLTAFGLVMIYSASSYSAQLSKAYNGNGAYFMQRQAGIAAVGLVAMLIISDVYKRQPMNRVRLPRYLPWPPAWRKGCLREMKALSVPVTSMWETMISSVRPGAGAAMDG